MDILSEKFQGKMIRIELGNGYPDLNISVVILLHMKKPLVQFM